MTEKASDKLFRQAAEAEDGMPISAGARIVHVHVAKGKMEGRQARDKVAKAATATLGAFGAYSKKGLAVGKAISKSSAVQEILRGNGEMTAKEVVSTLADKGIRVTEGLVYFVKGKMKGKRGRKRTVQVDVRTPASPGDAVKTILLIKSWASEIGGLKKLKGLVDALSE